MYSGPSVSGCPSCMVIANWGGGMGGGGGGSGIGVYSLEGGCTV